MLLRDNRKTPNAFCIDPHTYENLTVLSYNCLVFPEKLSVI